MPRELKPCGTAAAYRRHVRRGEPVDEACAQAARDQKNGRVAERRGAVAELVMLAVVDAPTGDEPKLIDELAEARDTLAMLTAAMKAGAPGMAAMAKERTALVERIKRLESAGKPKGSKLDELANRRAARLAGSAG